MCITMIFVVLGSQKFQFDRLLKKIDSLKSAGKIKEEIIAQIGYSNYRPSSFENFDFIEKEMFDQYIEKADTIICHGGTGVIITALKKGKKVIAIPRDSKYGEHIDDHQFQIVALFSKLNYLEALYDVDDLEKVLYRSKQKKYRTFQSTNAVFVNELRKDIEKIGKR